MSDGAIKIVVIGDGAVGKSCLLFAYIENKFPDGYQPTVFENKALERDFYINDSDEKSTVMLNLWDTAGQEEFDRIRPFSYRETDVFLVCFSVVSESSLNNLQQKWIPEIDHHCSTALKVLVGLKCDLRKTEEQSAVSLSDINIVKKQIGAVAYVETSALKQTNIDQVFQTSVTNFLNPPNVEPEQSNGCCIIL